ncbi:hypothetical protein JANET_266 [Bacillus phage Janet]|nr:hypothetical protein JANET_266 [Bacillus phage Janet]
MEIRAINWEVNFKSEMSELELYGIESVIDTYCNDEVFNFNHESLGLAYTSSSAYAMYSVCNGEFTYYDWNTEKDLIVSYFAVTTGGYLVMVCYDKFETEFMFELV